MGLPTKIKRPTKIYAFPVVGAHREDFLTKPENSLPIGIEPRTSRCYSEVLNR
jgi:hypothetical protein